MTLWPPSPVSLLVAAVGILLFAVVRRVYLHPLSRFPGHKLAAATYWYTTYYEVWKDGELVEHLGELHKRYGPVVRIDPNDLHFSDPKAYNDIYPKRFPKDPKLYGALHQDHSLFAMTDPREAKIRREIMGPLFSRRAIVSLEQVVLRKESVIGGYHVPTGTAVAMGSTFTGYNEDMFSEPYAFRPERWLQPGGSTVEVTAFSKGPRACLGINLTWCEMYLLFGYMFRKVDMSLYETSMEDMTFRCQLSPTYKGMLQCTVKSRQ